MEGRGRRKGKGKETLKERLALKERKFGLGLGFFSFLARDSYSKG